MLSFLFVWQVGEETKGVPLEDMHGEILHHDKTAGRLGWGLAREPVVTVAASAA